jgi:Skp family chaperone for outer membrane proteins
MEVASLVPRDHPNRQGVLNVTTFLSRATIVAAALAICLWTTPARAQTAARPSGTSVAVIDLGDVFEAHAGLKAQLEQIKTQIDSFEAYVRQEKQKIESLAEQLKTLKPGTPDYAGREKEFASIQADLQVQVRQKSREFLEQEAQIRYEAYQEIQQHVAKFCQSYGIQLVIRFNRQPIDASKPQEVQLGLNRPIVYQNSLDITQHIIESLNPAAGGALPATQPNVGVGQRPPAIPRGPQR